MGLWVRLELLEEGSEAVKIDSRIAPKPGELVITKKRASAFPGTNLQQFSSSRRTGSTPLRHGCHRGRVCAAHRRRRHRRGFPPDGGPRGRRRPCYMLAPAIYLTVTAACALIATFLIPDTAPAYSPDTYRAKVRRSSRPESHEESATGITHQADSFVLPAQPAVPPRAAIFRLV